MNSFGRNSLLSEEKLIEIASDYVSDQKSIWIERFHLKTDTNFSILIEIIRIEIATNKIRTIHQLDKYLTGKFQQEIKIIFDAKVRCFLNESKRNIYI